MMRRLLALASLILGLALAGPALATNCAAYPFTLTNGTLADASQVMSDFNSILTCANSSLAHNGANGDITSLTATTSITSTPVTFGAAVTGGASINIPPGTAPTTPNNGDLWETSAGLFGRINSVTGPFGFLTGTPANGNLAKFSGTASLTNGDLSGDCTTSGSLAITCTKSSGVALVVTTDSRFIGPTQNSQSAAYTFVLTDEGEQIYHPSADTTARTWTIPANASVAYPVTTKIELVNDCSAGVITLNITSDTLTFFPGGTTGTRTIAACGAATLTKVTSTKWVITGVGVS